MTFWLFALPLQGQNWCPFPYKQVTFWQHPNTDDVSMFYNDSIQVGNVHNLHHFGTKYYQRNLHDTCVQAVYDVQSMHSPLRNSPLLEGFYVAPWGDWKYATHNLEVPFLPYAEVGDSWSFGTYRANFVDSVSITCTRKGIGSTLGYTDSVKYFMVKSYWQGVEQSRYADAFILSKSAGFFKFMPFDKIISFGEFTPLNIFGFDHASQGHFGFTSAWQDYYCIPQVGDVEYWDKSESSGPYRITSTWQDSVTGVWVNADTLVREFQRTLLRNYSYNGQNTRTVLQKLDTVIFRDWELQIPNGVMAQNILSSGSEFLGAEYRFNNRRELELGFYNRFVHGMGFMGTSNCVFEFWDGVDMTRKYVRDVGFTYDYLIQMSGYESTALRGKRSCGRVYGTLTLGDEIVLPYSDALNVYPNPTTAEFRIELPQAEEQYDLTVCDMLGQCILSVQGAKDGIVDLSPFPTGSYILKLTQAGKTYLAKVIKQ